jgi:hypothetical protein
MGGRVGKMSKGHEVEQPAEKLVPAEIPNRFLTGHDFSHADRISRLSWALAPAGFIYESALRSHHFPQPVKLF